MNDAIAGHVFLAAASWNILWTTWVTTRPERPPANAAPWEMESFVRTNRQFHVVMAILTCGFLFVLAMLVDSWQRS